MEFIRDNWPYILLVIAIVVVLAYLVMRPKQRVRLTDSGPVRPHMTNVPRQDRGLAGEAKVAAAEFIHSPLHRKVSGVKEPADDDLTRIKGIGPKFADALQALGFHRFEQVARLTPAEIERLDPQLGVFSGRIVRDRVVEQADYLARNDIDGFEQRFGKL
jgi:predicted flap endonuclease-1-like 5' DNA nuclease